MANHVVPAQQGRARAAGTKRNTIRVGGEEFCPRIALARVPSDFRFSFFFCFSIGVIPVLRAVFQSCRVEGRSKPLLPSIWVRSGTLRGDERGGGDGAGDQGQSGGSRAPRLPGLRSMGDWAQASHLSSQIHPPACLPATTRQRSLIPFGHDDHTAPLVSSSLGQNGKCSPLDGFGSHQLLCLSFSSVLMHDARSRSGRKLLIRRTQVEVSFFTLVF